MLRTLFRPSLPKFEYIITRSLSDIDKPNLDSKKGDGKDSKIPVKIVNDSSKILDKTVDDSHSKMPIKDPYMYVPNASLNVREDPVQRIKRGAKWELHNIRCILRGETPPSVNASSDILIVGGGIVGTAIAYFLRHRIRNGMNITVVEKEDFTTSTSLAISTNGLHQHIPSRPKAQMAQFCAEFYRQLPKLVDDPGLEPVDLEYIPNSSLQLASSESAELLMDMSEMFKVLDWKHTLLTPEMLKKRFPWMNVDDIALGSLGLNKEGQFNQWNIVTAMRRTCQKYGTEFMKGNVLGMHYQDIGDALTSNHSGIDTYFSPYAVAIQDENGDIRTHTFSIIIVAAGARIGEIFNMFNVTGLSLDLPVEPRKRCVYQIRCPDGPGIAMPMVTEPSGLRFRRHGLMGDYLVWKDPDEENEPPVDSLDADNSFFDRIIQPLLVNRVPVFEDAQLTSSWAGLIDHSTWDENMFVGIHPAFHNVYFAGGLGNDEFMYAPAIGRAFMELIVDGDFLSENFHPFSYQRVLRDIKITDSKFS